MGEVSAQAAGVHVKGQGMPTENAWREVMQM